MRAAGRVAAAIFLAIAALWAPSAQATFHDVVVRELYPGAAASPEAEYVELQMYAPGQEFVGGHTVTFYGAGGAQVGSAKFPADVQSGANQATILLATTVAEAEFGALADLTMAPGLLDPAAGAVCWEQWDCVSWGGFSGSVKAPTGPPADPGGIPDGMALRRTIAPGCPTLLEAADDTNSSLADFFDAFPAPRPNSSPPSERACGSAAPRAPGEQQGESGSGRAAKRRPQTRLRRRPGRIVRRRTTVFRFTSNRRGSRFLCKLDRRRFLCCRSPFVARRLRPGRHVFKVKARAPDGATDRTPATWRFRVLRLGQPSRSAHRTARRSQPGARAHSPS